MATQLDLVEIIWDDASSLDHGWTDPAEERPTEQLVTTVGFLIAQTEKHLVIAHTTDGSWVNGRFQIPRAMVKKMRSLRPKRKPKQVTNGSE